jgi:hypothetical protein
LSPSWETGKIWFAKQNEETKRQILGQAAYEAYRAGAVKLSDFVGQRQSATWGSTRYARSLVDILGKEKARQWKVRGSDRQMDDALDAALDIITPQQIGETTDLRWLYPEGQAGREHLRALPVHTNQFLIDHLCADHPERIPWIRTQREAIHRALADPLLAESRLRRSNAGYWRVTLVGNADGDEHEYVVVALSLANLPGMSDSEFHQIVTMHWAEYKDLFKADGSARDRWIDVGKQKTGL